LNEQEPREQQMGRHGQKGPHEFKRSNMSSNERGNRRAEQQRGSGQDLNAFSSSENPATGSPGSLMKSFSQLVQERQGNKPKRGDESLQADPKSLQN